MQLKFADNTILDGLENATADGTTVKLEFLATNLTVEQLIKVLQDKKIDTFYIVNGETTSDAYLHFVNIIGVVGIDTTSKRIIATLAQKDATDIKIDTLQATIDALTLASLGV